MEDILRGTLAFKGERGFSAYEIAVKNGFIGTVDEWLVMCGVPERVTNMLNGKINGLASGSPLVASSINGMTDTSHIYVNTADGNWYYYNGTEWAIGGVYQAAQLSYGSVTSGYLTNESVSPSKIKGHSILNLHNCKDANITNDYKLNTTGGLIEESGYSTTDYIEVEPNMNLYSDFGMPTNAPVICFYDQNKTFLSSLYTAVNWAEIGHFVAPANCYYIRACSSTTKITDATTGIYTSSILPSEFIPYGEFSIDGFKLKDNSVAEKMLKVSSINDSKIQINSLDYKKLKGLITNLMNANDENNLTNYKLNLTGEAIEGANYTTSDYIEVAGNMDLYCDFNMANTGNAIAFYDENKTYISGITVTTNWTSPEAVTTPGNTKYIRICAATAGFTSGIKGCYTNCTAKPSEYIEYGKYILSANLDIVKPSNTIVVNPDGTGDFTNLRAAIESTNTTDTFVIEIAEGTYDVFADYTEEEINAADYVSSNMDSFCGLMVNGNITLKGVGLKENTIIKGELDPNTYAYSIREQISTLNLQGNIKLENLTVTSKYIRYSVHDDFTKTDTETTCVNCDFIQYVNSAQNGQNNAYGMGTRSGKITNFENCYFNPRFYEHTNHSFTKPSITTLKNCIATESFNVQDMGSGQKDKVYFNCCNAPCIRYSWYNNALETPCLKVISDNDIPLIYTDESEHITTDVKFIKNDSATTISKGSLIKRTDAITYDVLSKGDEHLFYGIALEDIANGEYGRVIIKNYILSSDLNIAAKLGDKFKIENSSLVVTTENNYIGVCDIEGYIKLIK